MMLTIPAFGEQKVYESRENKKNRVFLVPDAEESLFDSYEKLFLANGFEKKEGFARDTQRFAAYTNGTLSYFMNDFRAVRELSIAEEENSAYFDYADACGASAVSPQITQIHLEDYGMSYVIRLSDGRFIVIDGGNNFEPHVENLYRALKEGTPDGKPTVAAWIMSHPHKDHFHCMVGLVDRYGDEVQIEKVMFLFPEHDDLARYPHFAHQDRRMKEDTSSVSYIPRMYHAIEKAGAKIYTPHTGQCYRIGDAYCEFLASMDDTVHLTNNINALSYVIRMTLGSQVILWTTDASFEYARLSERYGAYLKADIMQIPHHGFGCGSAEAEIAGYLLVRPRVCFLPVSDENAYTLFSTHKKGTRHIFENMDVDEIIAGGSEHTITLPYEAPAYKKAEHLRKFREGLENCGARTWVFSDLSSACEEDFVFTFLNMTNVATTVWIELFFEDTKYALRAIKAEIPAKRMKRLNIVGEEVDGNALYFNWMALSDLGVPENMPFCVRFISEVPIVVSHQKHKESYRSSSV